MIRIIAIVGTNASGKSSVAIELAGKFGAEIISADSRQIYRGFDLCSGKVTDEEQRAVPHHLLDIRSIGEPFSVADYQKMAYKLIPEIHGRGKIPFIVGGTGLYVGAVVNGYELDDDEPDYKLRDELEALPLDELWARLNSECKAVLAEKPADAKNKRRIIRLLEKTASGKPPEYGQTPKYEVLQLGITWPMDILEKRIAERLETRIRQGMLDEVREYLDKGGSPGHLYNLGLEYRHILFYLTGKYTGIEEFKAELGRQIRRFAKRQLTWFKRDKTIRWLDMSADPVAQAAGLIKEYI